MTQTLTTTRPYKRASDGMWVVAVNLGTAADGRRKRVTVARKKRGDVINAAREKVRELEDGVVHGAGTATVESWLTYWLEHVIPHRALRPNTVRNYRTQIANSLIPELGRIRLAKLTAAHIREMHTNLADRGLSVSSSRLVHIILQRALDDAVHEGMIAKNPAKHVGRPKGETSLRPALDADQARHLIDTCRRADDPMTWRFALALLTGARQGEVLGLTWDRVHLEDGVIDLSWALVSVGQQHGCGDTDAGEPACGAPRNRPRNCPQASPKVSRGYQHIPLEGPLVLGPTKTHTSSRLVPLPKLLIAGLIEHRAAYPPGRHNLVWTNPRTGTPVQPATDHKNWHRALERAGLPAMPLHSARHTAATLMQQLKVDEAVRMQLLGHNSQSVHRRYAHVDTSLAREAIEGYGDALGLTAGG